ncbi:MAG: hypothetical protein U5R49_11320 [Deltaproteobacteria bacterium]|nr:hypothetical protein [Deltaproteobacteria bacterium]
MGLRKLFRPNPEKHEKRGDDCVRASDWGRAKLAYESALNALQKGGRHDDEAVGRVQEKLTRSVEALAMEHVKTAEDLMESGYKADALELLELALDLTRDPEHQADIKNRVKEMKHSPSRHAEGEIPDLEAFPVLQNETVLEGDDDEIFMALLGALPEAVQSAYASYGPSFQAGYVALNRGDFEFAADALSASMMENPASDTYIPLELATAYLNLRRLGEARDLLETFLSNHPEALPGYQTLCEVFWEMGAFDRADALLDALPETFQDSVAYALLRGEGFTRAGRHAEATAFYETFMEAFGRQDALLRALADAYEASGDLEKARDLYGEILTQCRTCRTPVDPLIQRKFADISFELGERSTPLLETYLSLAQTDPSNRSFYYPRIGQIYDALGNETEAGRFQEFARQVTEDPASGPGA